MAFYSKSIGCQTRSSTLEVTGNKDCCCKGRCLVIDQLILATVVMAALNSIKHINSTKKGKVSVCGGV